MNLGVFHYYRKDYDKALINYKKAASIHEQGIPFIYFGVEDHPYYHDPEDTFDKIPQDFFIEVVNFLTAFVIDVDRKIE